MPDVIDPTTTPDGDPKASADTLADLQKKIDELNANNARLDAELKKAIENRQKAKDEARRVAEEKGEYEKAKQIIEEQLAELKTKYNDSEIEELRAAKAERDALVEERRKELLARIPEGKRDEFKDVPLNVLSKVVSLLPGAPPVDGGGTHSKPLNEKKWSEMSAEEQNKFVAENTQAVVNRKIAESF